MSGLLWRLNRLRAMGPQEVSFRVGRALVARAESLGWGLARPPIPAGDCGLPWLRDMPSGIAATPYLQAADDVLAGRFNVFAMRRAELGFPPRWNRDPKTGTDAPLSFGKTLNYRDERLVGDIKYLWEPNRHLELVTLAQAWHLGRQARHAEGCRRLLQSWFDQCPYPLGPNWTSSLEHGLRLVNWAVAWHLLGGDSAPIFEGPEGNTFRRQWLHMIYQHCHFIAGHLSRHSSANNHLLGELLGLLVGSVTWPLWPECAGWRKQAATEFEREALQQTAPDGVNREQAVWYQHEVADMMLLCGLFGRANGCSFDPGYWLRIESMLEFFSSIMDSAGNVPMLGDADGALVVRFMPQEGFNPYKSLLATGAVLFGRADFAAKAGQLDDKTRWLLGDAATQAVDELLGAPVVHEPPRRTFPDGGYCVLGCNFGTKREIRVVADAGALGYLSIAAHGHADALSFTLAAGGKELLIDPGTYAFHTQQRWRKYFRGTSAHNTVRVDGADQSTSGGNFMWLRHARARLISFESDDEQDRFEGEHDGYQRLADPVTHRRQLALRKRDAVLEVTDHLTARKPHHVELFWHFAEGCEVAVQGDTAVATHGPVQLSITMPGTRWRPQLVRGQTDPPLGWVSRRFDERMASPTVVWQGSIDASARLVTHLGLSFSA